MPELGPKDLSFFNEVSELSKKSPFKGIEEFEGFIPDNKLLDLVEKYDQDFIGKGAEVVVVADKNKSESGKLIAFNYKNVVNPDKAKQTFYRHRIFSTLFPHNFPRFSASAGEDPNKKSQNISGTIRQEVKTGQLNSFKQKIKELTAISPTRYPFRKVKKVCRNLGISLVYDRYKTNFIFGADGGEYYVDTLIESKLSPWNIEKIIEYMKKNNFQEKEIDIVRRSIERLTKLEIEEYIKYHVSQGESREEIRKHLVSFYGCNEKDFSEIYEFVVKKKESENDISKARAAVLEKMD